MLSIKSLVSPDSQLKLHIEAQISSDVLRACDQFMQVELLYRDDVCVYSVVE
jgi:hypothetical protein